MRIRVKLVINIKMLGASDKTVSNNNNFTDVATFSGSELENISINSFIVIFLLSVISYYLLPVLFNFRKFVCTYMFELIDGVLFIFCFRYRLNECLICLMVLQ